ncbi:MAG: AmpG family muropeptide MFS transporter [Ignavibacteriaceae bacterium]
MKKNPAGKPWLWVPSLYFTEGLPYIIVMSLTTVMYKRLGISNAEIALFTSWLYLPWVIKPLWSPFVDILFTKRLWIISTQFFLGITLIFIAISLNFQSFFILSILIFYIAAFLSATHDIAADGFYMLGLNQKDQSFFIGIRSTFYRFAMIFGQGLLVIIAGFLEDELNEISAAWVFTLCLAGLFLLILFVYHKSVLPYPSEDRANVIPDPRIIFRKFADTFITFFRKERIVTAVLFILFYRLGEGQLVKMASPFLLDPAEAGGLGLSTESVGFIYGTVGVIALITGGITGGIAVSKKGLKFWIWWMIAAINLPDLVYVFLSITQTENFFIINSLIAVEQFGYGFGFTAFMMVLIYISEGEFKTAHYAIATGIMALGMMLPGMVSGIIQEAVGYKLFFIWVCISTIPSFIITAFLRFDPDFGKKNGD